MFVPLRWPLTIAALAVVAAGWVVYLRKSRACSADATCTVSAPGTATLAMLVIASTVVAISAMWGFIEQALMRALGGT